MDGERVGEGGLRGRHRCGVRGVTVGPVAVPVAEWLGGAAVRCFTGAGVAVAVGVAAGVAVAGVKAAGEAVAAGVSSAGTVAVGVALAGAG